MAKGKRGFKGLLIMGGLVLVAAVFHEKIKAFANKIPVVKDVVGKLEEQA